MEPPSGDRFGPLFPNPPSRIGGFGRAVRLFWRTTDPSLLTISADRTPPAGFRTVDSFALVPNATAPRYLLPLTSRSEAARSVELYGALSTPLRRAIRVAAGAGLRVGLVQPLLQSRAYVHARVGVPVEELAAVSFTHHLARVFDEERIVALISLGGGGSYSKPVVQVLSLTGAPIGFVKVGWDEVTRRLVVNEARMLRLCEQASLRKLRVPRLISAGRWNDVEMSVVSPLPEDVRRYPPKTLPPVAITEEVSQIADRGVEPLWEGTYADGLRRRIESGSESSRTPNILDWLRQTSAEARVRIGAWHGDWAPWNLATRGAELHAWDWEQGGDQVPLGFDVIHFYFQTGFIRDGMDLEVAIRHASAASAEALGRLGTPRGASSVLLGLYLLEISLRVDELLRLGGHPNPKLYPRIRETLRQPQAILGERSAT